jgi:hypothetical protein
MLEVQNMNRVERAVSCFKTGFSCSQALLSTYGTQFGLTRETALKVSGAFGGGMGRRRETSVTGVFMLIGLKHGMTSVDDAVAKEETYRLVNEFVARFYVKSCSVVI